MNKNRQKTTVIIIFTFSLFICFGCEIQQKAPASPSEILRNVYGDYFYEDLNGHYFSLGWPVVIDIGANNLDMTEKHGDIKSDDFKLSCDEPYYNYGETILLSLSAQARGFFCWEYNIEQNINGRWYLLN